MDPHSRDVDSANLFITNSADYLHSGITTRLMAKRLMKMSAAETDGSDGPPPVTKFRFLTGTLVPNSTIRAGNMSLERCDRLSEPSVHANNLNKTTSNPPDNDDLEAKKKISEQRGLDSMRQRFKSKSSDMSKPNPSSAEKLQTSASKENRKVSQRLMMDDMPDFANRRRSTLQSIQEAIHSSPASSQKLVNADSIDITVIAGRRQSSNTSKKLQFTDEIST